MKYTVVMVIITILTISGCSKKDTPPPIKDMSTLTESKSNDQEHKERIEEEKGEVKTPDTMFTGREDFFSSSHGIAPVDMTLGDLPLKDDMSAPSLERYNLVEHFITSLENGIVWSDYMVPSKVLLYKVLWEDRKIPSLREYVIAAELNQDDIYSYNVRLIVSDSSYGEGTINIIKEDNQYYIDDFFFDLDDLSLVRSEKEPFQPDYSVDVNNLVY